MAIRYEFSIQCNFCKASGPALPVKVCPNCNSHICRTCGIEAAHSLTPPAEGILRNIGRALKVSLGGCPQCEDPSSPPQAVVFRLPSW